MPVIEHTSLGKWKLSGVPHRGWICIDVEDLGAPDAVCEMCETMEIRYVHTMTHPDYTDPLECGCICAGHMEQDLSGARRREMDCRNRQKRRQSWVRRPWRISERGNEYRKVNGLLVVVYPLGNSWSGQIIHCESERVVHAKRRYPSIEAAKLAAFDGVEWCRTHWPMD